MKRNWWILIYATDSHQRGELFSTLSWESEIKLEVFNIKMLLSCPHCFLLYPTSRLQDSAHQRPTLWKPVLLFRSPTRRFWSQLSVLNCFLSSTLILDFYFWCEISKNHMRCNKSTPSFPWQLCTWPVWCRPELQNRLVNGPWLDLCCEHTNWCHHVLFLTSNVWNMCLQQQPPCDGVTCDGCVFGDGFITFQTLWFTRVSTSTASAITLK